MNRQELQKKLTALWEEFATLSRADSYFHKKRMFLYGQLVVYTKIFATVQRIKRLEDTIQVRNEMQGSRC